MKFYLHDRMFGLLEHSGDRAVTYAPPALASGMGALASPTPMLLNRDASWGGGAWIAASSAPMATPFMMRQPGEVISQIAWQRARQSVPSTWRADGSGRARGA
jgi:hypothetical protein